MNLLRKHWPLVLALAALWLTVAGVAWKSVRENDGQFIYALDDAWIHMAIAKNVVRHGVFGVTPHGFTAASSSLLWTFLLSGVYAACGVQELAPLVLNVLAATAVVVLAYWMLARGVLHLRPVYVLLTLLFLIYATPMPALIFSGMEHPLHIAVVIAFVYLAARVLAAPALPYSHTPTLPHSRILLLLLAPFVAAARYEGLFLGFVVFCLFLLRRRWVYAFALGALVVMPVALFAVWSVQQGAYVLPNSLLLKGNFIDVRSLRGIGLFLGGVAYRRCIRNPHVFYLVVAALLGFIARYDRRRGLWEEGQLAVVIFLGTTFLHLQFAMLGWFYRYESYVVALGIFATALSLVHHLTTRSPAGEGEVQVESAGGLNWRRAPRTVAILLLAVFPVMILGKRGTISLLETPKAMHDRYLEHYQLGRFVARFYNDGPIVINDAGAMTFFTNARVLDMYGLASREPIRFHRQPGGYTKDGLARWAKEQGARVAILQVAWAEVHEKVPDAWAEVGRWEMPRNVAFPEDTVTTFYAVDPSEAGRLAESLRAFAPELPKAIQQRGPYAGEPAEKSGGGQESKSRRVEE
jgi:hypothetical protein